MTKQHVLIPLDGSVFSRRILPHVRRLLHPEGTRVTLLRVGELPDGLTATPPRAVSAAWSAPMYQSAEEVRLAHHPIYSSQAEVSARAALETELLPDVRALRDLGYEVSVAIEFGDPAETIAHVVRAQRIDLVAMATHGRTGLSHVLLGSVAQRVLRSLSIPVLLIRPFDHLGNGRYQEN